MKQLILVVLMGAFIVILFDTFASIASASFQLDYSLFSVGSFLIYAVIGYGGAKSGNLTMAVLAAAIVGLIDSTLGWYVSWIIGPGRSAIELDLIALGITIIFVIIIASLIGFLGGLLSRWL
jgi:hypothetical protein